MKPISKNRLFRAAKEMIKLDGKPALAVVLPQELHSYTLAIDQDENDEIFHAYFEKLISIYHDLEVSDANKRRR